MGLKLLCLKEEFSCYLLDKSKIEELSIYTKGREVHYSDPKNGEADKNRVSVLKAIETEGDNYFSLNFNNQSIAHFILYYKNYIIGSAEMVFQNEDTVEFQSCHVSSEYYGKHLADLLYESRELFAQQFTSVGRINMYIRKENIASQKAAIRNGFIEKTNERDPLLLFEKQL